MADNRIALSSNAMQSLQACNSSLCFSNSSLGPSEFYSLPPAFENRENWISHDKHTAKYLLPALGDQLKFCDEQPRLKNTEKLTLAFAPDPIWYKNYRSNFGSDFQQLIRELLTNSADDDGEKEKCRFYGSRADDDGGKKKKGFHGRADDDGDEGFHGSNPDSDDYYDCSGAADDDDDDDDDKDKYGFHGSNPDSDDYYDGSGAGADDDAGGKDKYGFHGSEPVSFNEDPSLILTRCINAWDKRKLKPFWLGFLMLFVYLLHRIAHQNQALILHRYFLCINHFAMLYNYHEIITVTVMAVVILTLWIFWLFAGSVFSFFVSLLILLIICICIDENTWSYRYL